MSKLYVIEKWDYSCGEYLGEKTIEAETDEEAENKLREHTTFYRNGRKYKARGSYQVRLLSDKPEDVAEFRSLREGCNA